ncbi:hypothetical protein [Tenacibaculum phage Larrie]|nr:hypothetical protein [Tenacibaculum phage Larrie]
MLINKHKENPLVYDVENIIESLPENYISNCKSILDSVEKITLEVLKENKEMNFIYMGGRGHGKSMVMRRIAEMMNKELFGKR